MISILIVEDQTIVCSAFEHSFNSYKDFQVVATTSDASTALSLCQKYHPDIVLMDICTQNNASGIDATKEIKTIFPNLPVVLMTGVPELSFIERAKEAGADSFIYKDIDFSALINILYSTIKGYGIYPRANSSEKIYSSFEQLTIREKEVLSLLCAAQSRSEIAETLNLSDNTVKSYISSILSKTGFTTTTKLAMYAVSHGYINPNI